jgi:hypothetical protein
VGRAAFIVGADGERLPIIVSTALLRDERGRVVGGAERFRDLSAIEELRKELSGRFEIGDFVSRSPAMRRVFDILPQVAASDCTVLVQGRDRAPARSCSPAPCTTPARAGAGPSSP